MTTASSLRRGGSASWVTTTLQGQLYAGVQSQYTLKTYFLRRLLHCVIVVYASTASLYASCFPFVWFSVGNCVRHASKKSNQRVVFQYIGPTCIGLDVYLLFREFVLRVVLFIIFTLNWCNCTYIVLYFVTWRLRMLLQSATFITCSTVTHLKW